MSEFNTDFLISLVKQTLGRIKTSAHDTSMQPRVDKEVGAAMDNIRSAEEEQFVKSIQSATKGMLDAMANTPSIWVAHHNVEFMFKRSPILQHHADEWVDRIEATGKNAVLMVFAFHAFIDMNYFFDMDMSENGEHIIDMPHDQIMAVMDEIATLALNMPPEEFQTYANKEAKRRIKDYCKKHRS